MTKAYYILFLHVIGFYVLTTIKYWMMFFKNESRLFRKARMLLFMALGAHSLLLAHTTWINGRYPVLTVGEGLLLCAWMVALGHLTSEFFAQSKPWGTFTLLPVTTAVAFSIFLMEPTSSLPHKYNSTFFAFHIVSSLAAFACLAIAAVLSCIYIILFKKLKGKRFDLFFRNLPPLDNIELLMSVWVFFGTTFMIISSIIGWTWVRRTGESGMNPAEWGILIVLLLFTAIIIGRMLFNFKGMRFAVVVASGFMVLLVSQLLNVHGS
jgi:ABC-type uncharacterized transport system permease subunit